MSCPRCGQPDVTSDSCPRCGVVFAKLRGDSRHAPASHPPDVVEDAPPRQIPWGLLVTVTVLALGLVGVLQWIRPAGRVVPPPVTRAGLAPGSAASEQALPDLPVPPATLDLTPGTLPAQVETGGGLTADERQRAADLTARVNSRQPVLPQDVQAAEMLLASHPEERALRDLLLAVLLHAAAQERQRSDFAAAAGHLERAAAVQPANMTVWLWLLGVRLEAGDWAGAETAARSALALDSRNAEALTGLGWALFRQDRNREAAEALQAALEVRADPTARALLARIRKGQSDEAGMTEQQLAHFHVRYNGAEHQDVGREILRALERHYATLVTTLDHQPASAIPVILFSSEAYYDASGAPSWSGGVYDGLDGRIRIPIGGLTASLTPEMDGTLIHELTHAFVADRTRGIAPREIHEGLAQYMEGKRIESMLEADGLRALASGRLRGVGGFYLNALSLVEYLIARRGLGGINDLLKQMGESGSVEEAFRRVHGQGFQATVQAWQQRLREQYGG
jgi:Flp pilus assembly protein TadD